MGGETILSRRGRFRADGRHLPALGALRFLSKAESPGTHRDNTFNHHYHTVIKGKNEYDTVSGGKQSPAPGEGSSGCAAGRSAGSVSSPPPRNQVAFQPRRLPGGGEGNGNTEQPLPTTRGGRSSFYFPTGNSARIQEMALPVTGAPPNRTTLTRCRFARRASLPQTHLSLL